jgi:hypothetical protein
MWLTNQPDKSLRCKLNLAFANTAPAAFEQGVYEVSQRERGRPSPALSFSALPTSRPLAVRHTSRLGLGRARRCGYVGLRDAGRPYRP